jgi:hypothetical protein
MALSFEGDEVLSAAISGLPKIVELIERIPAGEKPRALDAAKNSYVQTAVRLGYEETAARQWAATIMYQLQTEVPHQRRRRGYCVALACALRILKAPARCSIRSALQVPTEPVLAVFSFIAATLCRRNMFTALIFQW